MSAATGGGGRGDASGDAEDGATDGARADESGYRRDDYWREEARESTAPDEVPEPEQGYRFAEPDERGRDADDGSAEKRSPGADPSNRSTGPGDGRDESGGRAGAPTGDGAGNG